MKNKLADAVTLVETDRDPRGWVSNLLDFLPLAAANLKNVHLVEMKPGAIRGNHKHAVQYEWIVICGGPCRIALADKQETFRRNFDGRKPVMLSIPPGVAHAVKYLGQATAYLVCLTDNTYNFDKPDLERVNLIS